MPCSKYKSPKQRKLCYATKEWADWTGIRKKKKYRSHKKGGSKRTKKKR